MRILVGFALLGLLLGCQSNSGVRDSLGGPYLALQGGALVLEQPLTVPAGMARLFVQDGVVVGDRGLGGGRYYLYRPHCALEIDTVDLNGFQVDASTFPISRVERNLRSVVSVDRSMVASSDPLAWGYRRNSDRYHEGFHFWLAAPDQPAVRRLSCYGIYARWIDLRPPTLDEINVALGRIGHIRGPLPGEW